MTTQAIRPLRSVSSFVRRQLPGFAYHVAGVFFLLIAARLGAADPAEEQASFQVAEGFEVNLFASEADGVVKPIQIRFDAAGRLWVIGSTVYPQIEPGQIPNDKVLVLEDSDGDGRCDKTTVFADGLRIPTGIELGDGGAYVGHGTELLFLKDHDGDGKADEHRVVLRGFGTADNHQNINSFAWGPGGELWMSQGLHARSRVETPWGIASLAQAGLWRLRLRRLQLEGFYGTAHEPQNPWGFVFTKWGEPIVLSGNNSSPIYPVPGLVSRRREAPPTVIWKNGQGRKVSGGDIVGTTHFPEPWQGRLLVGGYINNAIWSLEVFNDGAGFVLEDAPPLLKSTSRNFRPVDVKFGPDGALYVCDWFNPIIGHYQASFRHPDRDKTHGRIWRITAKGRPLTSRPELVNASVNRLLDHLLSPDRWTRHFAKRELSDRPKASVIPQLEAWVQKTDLSEHALKEALGIFQSHEVVAPDLLARLCAGRESDARAYAASVVAHWADRLADPLALLRPLVADPHPRVRLQAVVACTYVPKAEAMEVAAIAADGPVDKFLTYALNQAVFALKPFWLERFKAGALAFENHPARLALLVNADGTRDTLQLVRSLLQSDATPPGARETFYHILIEAGEGSDFAAILKVTDPELLSRLLPAMTAAVRIRKVSPPADAVALIGPLLQPSGTPGRGEALRLAASWKLSAFHPAAEALALDVTANERARQGALDALAKFGDETSRAILLRVAHEAPIAVRTAAIRGLSDFDLEAAARISGEMLAQLDDERAAGDVVSVLLEHKDGAAALSKSFNDKPPSRAAAEAALRVLAASGRRHDGLLSILTTAAGIKKEEKKMTPAEIASFAGEVAASGDASRGAEIFRRPELGCIACHAVSGEGGDIGPELGTLGTAQPIDFIVGAILDPGKEVKEGYVSISVTTADGREFQGYQVRETNEELVLRDTLQNQEVRLPRETIKNKSQHGSIMPPGLVDGLRREEFRDLVRFLSDLGKPR